MSHKAPSEGQKVTPGKDAPTYQEGAGVVTESSLAAESLRAGGEFAENRGVRTGGSAEENTREHGGGTDSRDVHDNGNNSNLESQRSYAGEAPTYLAGQFARDPHGPHGKNLTEGGFEGSGTSGAPLSEPGSAQDPARVAEAQLNLAQTKQGRDAGERQLGLSGETPYNALDRDTAA